MMEIETKFEQDTGQALVADGMKEPKNGWTCACNTNFAYRNYHHYLRSSTFQNTEDLNNGLNILDHIDSLVTNAPAKCFNQTMITEFFEKLSQEIDNFQSTQDEAYEMEQERLDIEANLEDDMMH
jgi:hypothetical protein